MIWKSRPLTSAAAAAALGVALLAAPGGADTTTMSLAVVGGGLVIDGPDTASASGALGSTAQIPVNGILINDGRGTLAGWTATVSSTSLTTGAAAANQTIATSALTWNTVSITPNQGQASIALPAGGSLDTTRTIATGLPAVSGGSFTANGRVDVAVPAGNLAGTYTGTLTTSIS